MNETLRMQWVYNESEIDTMTFSMGVFCERKKEREDLADITANKQMTSSFMPLQTHSAVSEKRAFELWRATYFLKHKLDVFRNIPQEAEVYFFLFYIKRNQFDSRRLSLYPQLTDFFRVESWNLVNISTVRLMFKVEIKRKQCKKWSKFNWLLHTKDFKEIFFFCRHLQTPSSPCVDKWRKYHKQGNLNLVWIQTSLQMIKSKLL